MIPAQKIANSSFLSTRWFREGIWFLHQVSMAPWMPGSGVGSADDRFVETTDAGIHQFVRAMHVVRCGCVLHNYLGDWRGVFLFKYTPMLYICSSRLITDNHLGALPEIFPD